MQDIYLYDFSASSWSKQSTTSPPDLSSGGSTVLDHDTNVVFTLPGGNNPSLYTLDLSGLASATSAGSASVAWEAVSEPGFSAGDVAMAQASQHICECTSRANTVWGGGMYADCKVAC